MDVERPHKTVPPSLTQQADSTHIYKYTTFADAAPKVRSELHGSYQPAEIDDKAKNFRRRLIQVYIKDKPEECDCRIKTVQETCKAVFINGLAELQKPIIEFEKTYPEDRSSHVVSGVLCTLQSAIAEAGDEALIEINHLYVSKAHTSGTGERNKMGKEIYMAIDRDKNHSLRINQN